MAVNSLPLHTKPRIVARGMLRECTPLEDHREAYGLWVKREDKACVPPGPPFSKARGVFAHIARRKEDVIGVLDTRHSQAGHAVARACQVLGKRCINFYPEFKGDTAIRAPQMRSMKLGAELHALPAGRSAILYHQAKKEMAKCGAHGYLMPNALKLEESVIETALEYPLAPRFDAVIIPSSSGTIAAGVVKGALSAWPGEAQPIFIIHMGYSRSVEEMKGYILDKSGCRARNPMLTMVNELYAYADSARPGETPPWPCNEYYDLKAFRWWLANRGKYDGMNVLFWNIG